MELFFRPHKLRSILFVGMFILSTSGYALGPGNESEEYSVQSSGQYQTRSYRNVSQSGTGQPRRATRIKVARSYLNQNSMGNSTLMPVVKAAKPVEPAFSMSTFVGYSSNFLSRDPEKQKAEMNVLSEMKVKVYSRWSFYTKVIYNQDLKESEKSDVNNIPLTMIYRFWNAEDVYRFQPSLIFVTPTSKFSRQDKHFQYGTGAGAKLIVHDHPLIHPKVKLEISANLIRNFHQIDTEFADESLNKYSSTQRLFLAYEGSDFFTSFELLHINGMNYESEMKQSYSHTEEIGYNLSSNFGIAVGHSLSGNAIGEDGESNYTFSNGNDSMYYLGLGFGF